MFHVKQKYDVIVIGGGHAGCEASLAAARKGIPTLLITMNPLKIAEMSCNPSIGGVGKGQLVKEIDALGGEMGRNADFTAIQFKRLNTRKGSAVQSSRCQSDKRQYALRMQQVIADQPNLDVAAAEVKALRVDAGQIVGVQIRLPGGEVAEVGASNVVITAGTFMQGLMHCGDERATGGRAGEESSQGLSTHLKELGFTILRLKTGTPPRLLRDSIDFSQMERQGGDEVPYKFSFFDTHLPLPQVDCFLTYTSPATHTVIRDNLARSPLYSGQIKGIGPRYCPSIEDKVVKFPEKSRHQLFFEPEALDSDWIYPNGISTSLPADVQDAFVRSIAGCENVKFARHGYAVEYDCIDPRQLYPSLESRLVKGLFLAGQVNGTSGYEEAAAQGLVAGINAALRAQERPPFHLSREEAYIGVMIDDLVTLGVTEPYRMFTSRAEFRLSLREDNADLRLSHRGHAAGVLTDADFAKVETRRESIRAWKAWLGKLYVKATPEVNALLTSKGTAAITGGQSLAQLMKRPELGLVDVLSLVPERPVGLAPLEGITAETLEVELKYEGYIAMQQVEITRLQKMQELEIPQTFNYKSVAGLSYEIQEKLSRDKPKTLAAAARISGVTPAALTALLSHLRQKGADRAHAAV